jgi:sec-independent protein translocase protein TatB
MLNIGAGEIALIAVVALLILGPTRLPELARGIGKVLRDLRRQTDDVRTTLESEFYRMDRDLREPRTPRAPPPIPLEVPPQVARAISGSLDQQPMGARRSPNPLPPGAEGALANGPVAAPLVEVPVLPPEPAPAPSGDAPALAAEPSDPGGAPK